MVNENDHVVDAAEDGTGAPEIAAKSDSAEVEAGRAALVNQWIKDVKEAREHWAPSYKRMDICMRLAANGTIEKSDAEAVNGSYVVPILNRFVNQAVASLYAKNPKAIAKRKDKLLYQIWDGDPASIAQAMQMPPVTSVDPMTGQPVQQIDPQAAALLQEIQEVKQQLTLYDRMAKTMSLLYSYYLEEQDCGYKELLKAMVRRTKVCGVAYVELDFQRLMKKNPDVAAQIADTTSQILAIETGIVQLEAGQIEEGTAKMEELKLLLADLQNKTEIIAREGPVLSFPRSKDIIPDKRCKHLKTFAGSRWIAREYDLMPEEIQETWGVDVGSDYTAYTKDGKTSTDKKKGCCRVWKIQDKRNQQVLVVCDGYPDFIVEPSEPTVKIERFWTIFALVFNEIEPGEDEQIFPPSDVWNARHMQREYNSQRQGLREHRIAGRPGWVAAAGKLSEDDKKKMAVREGFEVLEMQGLTPGEDVKALLQAFPVAGVDPNLYEVETTFSDIQRTVGAQEANFGGTSGSTATESSIAENSRSAGNSSDVDDLDDLLSALARGMGQLMLTELSKETVIEIAGPGAVWPDMPPTREQIVKDLILETEAGSSGRPNKAAELANMERGMPFITMLPNVNPVPIAKRYLGLLDIDVEEAIVEGMPSITALNAMASKPPAAPTGAGPDDPNAQGDKGGNNAPGPNQANEPQGQPGYDAPGESVPSY